MGSERSEVEESPNETIHVGEFFPLFAPTRTYSQISETFGVPIFKSEITLASEVLPSFPLYIAAIEGRIPRYDALTPFTPEQGYQVDHRDRNYRERRGKLAEAEWQGYLSLEQNPLSLHVENFVEPELHAAGFIKSVKKHVSYAWEEAALRDLCRLRLQLLIETERNRLSFEAMPDVSNFFGIHFNHFYPTDTGPLPAAHNRILQLTQHTKPGLHLAVPSNIDHLRTIQAKFIFANPLKPKE